MRDSNHLQASPIAEISAVLLVPLLAPNHTGSYSPTTTGPYIERQPRGDRGGGWQPDTPLRPIPTVACAGSPPEPSVYI